MAAGGVGQKCRLSEDEQLTIWITELGMAESEPGMQRADWVWACVADVCGRWLKREELLVERVCGDVSGVSGLSYAEHDCHQLHNECIQTCLHARAPELTPVRVAMSKSPGALGRHFHSELQV